IRDDPAAPPLCVQIRDNLRRCILEGRLKPDESLVPQRRLCRILNVNQVTLTKAMGDLLNEGLLRSEHGRGLFVNNVEAPVIGLIYPTSRKKIDTDGVYGPMIAAAAAELGQKNVRTLYLTREMYDKSLRFGPALHEILKAKVDAY